MGSATKGAELKSGSFVKKGTSLRLGKWIKKRA